MLTRIRKLLAPPVFEDEDKTRAAGLVNAFLLTVLACAALFPVAATLVRASVSGPIISLASGVVIITTSIPIPPAPIDLVTVLITLGSTAVLSHIAMREIAGGYERVRRKERALTKSNRHPVPSSARGSLRPMPTLSWWQAWYSDLKGVLCWPLPQGVSSK